MVKTVTEYKTDLGGNTTVEYSDGSTNKFNITDAVTAQVNPVTGGIEIWVSGEKVKSIVSLKAGSESYAAENASRLQAALDVGGLVEVEVAGLYYIDRTLTIYSDTTLRMASGVKLKLTTGIRVVMLQNNGFRRMGVRTPIVSGSLVWSGFGPGIVATVANNFSVGDWVSIHGASQSGFNGVFRISAASPSQFTYHGDICPSVTTATKDARYANITFDGADKNIFVEGGDFDWNTDGILIDGTAGNAIMLANLVKYGITGAKFRQINTRCIFVANARSGEFSAINCESTAVTIQTNGAIHGLIIDGVHSYGTDDCIAIMAREATGFPLQEFSQGDVINVDIRTISSFNSGKAVRILNCGGNMLMDSITVDGVSGYSPDASCTVEGDVPGLATGLFSRVTFKNISSTCYNASVRTDYATIKTLHIDGLTIETLSATFGGIKPIHIKNSTIQSLVIDRLITRQPWLPSVATGAIFIDTTATVFVWSVNDAVMNSSGNGSLLVQDGASSMGTFRNVKMDGGGRIYTSSGSGSVNVVSVENCEVNGSVNSLSTTGISNLRFNGYRTSGGTNAMQVANAVNISGGGFMFGGMNPISYASGAIRPYSFDLPMDVGASGMSKSVSGQYCFNTTVRGTLEANRMVSCNGTNWVQVDTQANVF